MLSALVIKLYCTDVQCECVSCPQNSWARSGWAIIIMYLYKCNLSNSIKYSSHATTHSNLVIVPTSYDEYTALVKSGNVASKHVNGWRARSKRQV